MSWKLSRTVLRGRDRSNPVLSLGTFAYLNPGETMLERDLLTIGVIVWRKSRPDLLSHQQYPRR